MRCKLIPFQFASVLIHLFIHLFIRLQHLQSHFIILNYYVFISDFFGTAFSPQLLYS